MIVAARVYRSPDSWPGTEHPQISLFHSPTPPKCSTRATLALINNLGIVYHQYCSSSVTDSFAGTSCFRGETTPRAEVSGAASATASHQRTTSPGWTTYKAGQTWKLTQPTRRIGINVPGMETTSWACPSSVTSVRFEMWWVGIRTNPTRRTSSRSRL